MANQEIQDITAVRDLSGSEMEQTNGGAAYIKFDGIDGEISPRSSGTERSAVVFVGGWGSSMYQY